MKSKIESFEDLFVYQKAREFSRKIADLVKELPEEEKFKLKDQMTRARRSIGSLTYSLNNSLTLL